MREQPRPDEACQRENADFDAFAARLPVDAFEPIARALAVNAEPKNLAALRDWLLPEFHFFYLSIGKQRSRAERLRRLKALRDAAAVVSASLGPGGAWVDLPWGILREIDGDFQDRVKELEEAATTSVRRILATPSPRGRPPKSAFRDLTPALMRIYERQTGHAALKPHWLPDSRRYGGKFYPFAVAVWRCLRSHIRESKDALPPTQSALADELRKHWPADSSVIG